MHREKMELEMSKEKALAFNDEYARLLEKYRYSGISIIGDYEMATSATSFDVENIDFASPFDLFKRLREKLLNAKGTDEAKDVVAEVMQSVFTLRNLYLCLREVADDFEEIKQHLTTTEPAAAMFKELFDNVPKHQERMHKTI